MANFFEITSRSRVYKVYIESDFHHSIKSFNGGQSYFIIDKNVSIIYASELDQFMKTNQCLVIDSSEDSKSIERVLEIAYRLLKLNIRRQDTLVAIGGGVIQDITCFISSILFRGVDWKFFPTTLLAQADSCIGSKSSINFADTKNILGTFNPPSEIFIDYKFLQTLERKEILSGIGEIIKVHAISGKEAFNYLAKHYDGFCLSTDNLIPFIEESLKVKKMYIEEDEFDVGVRNIFNYGHSFGHAIEVASKFSIPHGIAVTMGMDMANTLATKIGYIKAENAVQMGMMLRKNYIDYIGKDINFDDFMLAITKDKKNTSKDLVLILPAGDECKVSKMSVKNDSFFKNHCAEFFIGMRNEKK